MSDSIQPILTTQPVSPTPAGAALEAMYVHLAVSDPEVLLAASEFPEGRARTLFELQARDWRTGAPVRPESLARGIRRLELAGA